MKVIYQDGECQSPLPLLVAASQGSRLHGAACHREMYQLPNHAGLVYYDGGPHILFRSDIKTKRNDGDHVRVHGVVHAGAMTLVPGDGTQPPQVGWRRLSMPLHVGSIANRPCFSGPGVKSYNHGQPGTGLEQRLAGPKA